jgi:hypothetical protein
MDSKEWEDSKAQCRASTNEDLRDIIARKAAHTMVHRAAQTVLSERADQKSETKLKRLELSMAEVKASVVDLKPRACYKEPAFWISVLAVFIALASWLYPRSPS